MGPIANSPMSWDELVCSSAAASGELEASVLQGASVVRSQGLRSVSYRVTDSEAEKVERAGARWAHSEAKNESKDRHPHISARSTLGRETTRTQRQEKKTSL